MKYLTAFLVSTLAATALGQTPPPPSQSVPAERSVLSPSLIKISINAEISDWKKQEDSPYHPKDSETNSIYYTVYLVNHATNALEGIRIEYCLYRNRGKYIEINNTERIAGTLQAGKAWECRTGGTGFKSEGFLNEIVGLRVRAYMQANDGVKAVEEVCFPEDLSADKYPWKENRQNAQKTASNPSSYPDKNMSEQDVKDLAETYIDAMERKDFNAWKMLLAPMHPDHSALDENDFNRQVHQIESIEIENISGRDVTLSIRNTSGRKSTGYLIIHSSGHIKYTPFVFEHPVRIATQAIAPLLSDNLSFRNTSMQVLKKVKVPLFDYDLNASGAEQKKVARRILNWLRENGAEHDITEPKVRMSDAELQDRIKLAEYNVEHYPYSH